MPVFAPTNVNQSKVHYAKYIRTENKPDDTETKPTEPAKPAVPEVK